MKKPILPPINPKTGKPFEGDEFDKNPFKNTGTVRCTFYYNLFQFFLSSNIFKTHYVYFYFFQFINFYFYFYFLGLLC